MSNLNPQPSDTPIDPTLLTPPVQKGIPGQDLALVTARRAKAVALRTAGLSYAQIAEQVGYSDGSSARTAVIDALGKVQELAVSQYREIENGRLDALQAAIWRRAMNGDIQAVRAVLRISERRSKLNGLDAPLQIEVVDGVDEKLGELRAALAEDGVFHVVRDEEAS